MKSILLTGGTGFIGTNLINSFKNKFKIYVLKRKSNKKLSIDNHKMSHRQPSPLDGRYLM